MKGAKYDRSGLLMYTNQTRPWDGVFSRTVRGWWSQPRIRWRLITFFAENPRCMTDSGIRKAG